MIANAKPYHPSCSRSRAGRGTGGAQGFSKSPVYETGGGLERREHQTTMTRPPKPTKRKDLMTPFAPSCHETRPTCDGGKPTSPQHPDRPARAWRAQEQNHHTD